MTDRTDWALTDSPEAWACFYCGRRIPPNAQHWRHGDGLRMCWGCRGPQDEPESSDVALRLVPKPEEPCSEP